MAVFSDIRIIESIYRHELGINPFIPANVKPSSIHLTLDVSFRKPKSDQGTINVYDKDFEKYYETITGPIVLKSKDFIIGQIKEQLTLSKNMTGTILRRSIRVKRTVRLVRRINEANYFLGSAKHIQEELENAIEDQYNRLLVQSENQAKDGNTWLKTLLNSYVRNTPVKYAFAETDQAQNAKVRTIIMIISKGETEYKGFFSKKNNNFSAFITYKENPTNSSIIEEIKMFSLTQGETELGKDLVELVNKLLVNHSKVKWSARSDNLKAIKHYNLYVRHEFGQKEQKIPDKFGLIHYSVP